MSRKKFVEDFSDLDIEREYVTKDELLANPEVQRKGKQLKTSKLVIAVISLIICLIGGISVMVLAQHNAQQLMEEQGATTIAQAQKSQDNGDGAL